MVFKGTQANISNESGDLLMSSNGIWIANSSGDTMMNGGGLNPSYLATAWPYGIPLGHGNLTIPLPGDSNKLVLFHMSRWGQFALSLSALYKTEIDLQLDGGLGGITNKNDTLTVDTLSWGVGSCKHSNGRDWWVISVKDGNPVLIKYLITPTGVDTITTQLLPITSNTYGNVSPIIFSQDGSKVIYCTPINQVPSGKLIIADFDRCTGTLSNIVGIMLTPNEYLLGLSFSPSGKFVYACSSNQIFQVDTDNLSVDTVATYDGFVSPVGSTCCATTFWNMYLAANGKIYVTSGSGVQHIHEINYPDSAGIACDVQQHAIDLGYAQLRSVPNHPNYYLGCDTALGCPCLTTVIEEHGSHEFRFNVAPNPTSGNFKITYLLPQNQPGKLEIFDTNGRRIYEMNLPQWSTMQEVILPKSISSGVYNCVITSGGERGSRKVVVYKE
ncbi:MAG: T9SS type A sorting domain-containing protein [Bacteroidetes bacterium]|nr:T9SS type A sorting domain-containing protein [Bacteroidota bacterium]